MSFQRNEKSSCQNNYYYVRKHKLGSKKENAQLSNKQEHKLNKSRMGQKQSRRYTDESIDSGFSSFADHQLGIIYSSKFPYIQDKKTIHYVTGSKVMFILRGLSGSGKTYLANEILRTYKDYCVICSADDYFVQQDGSYQFERTLLRDAHEYCQKKAVEFCKKAIPAVIIDNTNVKLWEMEFYIKLAKKMDYCVVIAEPKTPWKFNVQELTHHSQHEMKKSTLEMRLNQWELNTPLFYGWFLNSTDSKNLLEVAKAYFESCFEIPEFYSELQNICRTSNKKDIISYYQGTAMVENRAILHCTARFCGGIKSSGVQDYASRKDVQENYGKSTIIHIIGFVITSNTFGARVKLTKNQLKLWDMEDSVSKKSASGASSDFLVSSMQRLSIGGKQHQNKNETQGHQLLNESLLNIQKPPCTCIPTLRVGPQHSEDIFSPCSGLGSRAHATLGCAPNVKPQQTGLDLINAVQHEKDAAKNPSAVSTYDISIGKLRHYSNGMWVIYPSRQQLIEALFTFYS